MKSKKEILQQLGFTVEGSEENTMLFNNIISQAMDEYAKDLAEMRKGKYIQVLNHCLNDALVVPQTKIKQNKMHSNGIAEFINDWYKKNFI